MALENHEAHIVIGTHALIQDDVFFDDLGLVIVDEQHRFGVEQRRKLRDKGLDPDVLFMTATPIPRTLAITAFGDMDVSVIDRKSTRLNSSHVASSYAVFCLKKIMMNINY